MKRELGVIGIIAAALIMIVGVTYSLHTQDRQLEVQAPRIVRPTAPTPILYDFVVSGRVIPQDPTPTPVSTFPPPPRLGPQLKPKSCYETRDTATHDSEAVVELADGSTYLIADVIMFCYDIRTVREVWFGQERELCNGDNRCGRVVANSRQETR